MSEKLMAYSLGDEPEELPTFRFRGWRTCSSCENNRKACQPSWEQPDSCTNCIRLQITCDSSRRRHAAKVRRQPRRGFGFEGELGTDEDQFELDKTLSVSGSIQDYSPTERPQEFDIADPQNISDLRVDPEETSISTSTTVVIEANVFDSAPAHEIPALPNSRAFVCTPFSLLVSAVIIGIGAPKAIASYRGEEVVVNDLDWIIGVPVAFVSFWLGVLKEQGSLSSLKWLLHDDFRDILIPACRS